MPESVDLADVFDAHGQALLDGMHTAMPGRVQSYNPSTGTADILPMVKRVMFDADGNQVFEDLPVIPNVPIAWMRAGGFCLTMPLAVGDSVLLIFSHVDTGGWRSTGEVSEPKDVRRMSLGFPFAVPCIAPDAQALQSADTSAMYIGKDGTADQQIKLDGSHIYAPANASDFVALSMKVDANFNTLVTAINTHVHPTAALGPPSVPTPGVGGLPVSVNSTAATILKAK